MNDRNLNVHGSNISNSQFGNVSGRDINLTTDQITKASKADSEDASPAKSVWKSLPIINAIVQIWRYISHS